MGRTWKYKTMFDLDMSEDSFGDILFNAGVDVIAIDYDQFDTHDDIYKQARMSASMFKPDLVMGYCYGAFPATHAASILHNKSLILLDPTPRTPYVENSLIVDIESFEPLYFEDSNFKNEYIIKNPPLPVNASAIRSQVHIFVTQENENSEQNGELGLKSKFFKNIKIEVIQNSSHWIMLEPARYTLANKILEIMNA